MARLTRRVPTHSVGVHRRRRRGAYPRARFREAERIARKGDVARLNNVIPYRYLPPANCIRSERRTSLSLRQRMTVFGFFGGVLLSIRAGAWIRAPTSSNRRRASALPESGDGSRLTRRVPTHSVGTRRFFCCSGLGAARNGYHPGEAETQRGGQNERNT